MTPRITLLFLLLACGGAPSHSALPREPAAASIEWQAYSPEVFERARAEGKLVLLDVGIEGCTACRWMLEDTYAHAAVVRRITEHFIAVSIDANARPDLGEQYLPWAWPATIVLTPDGERRLALRGNRRPRNFVPILDALIAGETPPDGAVEGLSGPLDAGCETVAARVRHAESSIGGWGRGFRGVQPELIREAFMNHESRDHALRTAEGYSQLLDEVWGGVYIAGLDGWADFIPEKRIPQQAGALLAFAHAFALTGDELWLEHLTNVDRYVQAFLWDGEGFYAAQRDEPSTAPGRSALEGQGRFAYFALDDARRRALGTPVVDQGVYSALNGEAVEHYALAARLLGDAPGAETLRARALSAGRRLLRRSHQGVVTQLDGAIDGARLRPGEAFDAESMTLETQARVGLAFVALYDLTHERSWLDAASTLGNATREHLRSDAGYVASPGLSVVPVLANARVARLFYSLLDRTHDVDWNDAGEHALRAAAQTERLSPSVLGALALAYRAQQRGLIDVSIVGSPPDELLSASRLYAPSARVHVDEEARYPASDEPLAYVCTRTACSQPFSALDELRAEITRASAEYALCAAP